MRKGIPAKIRKPHWIMIAGIALALSIIFTSLIYLLIPRQSSVPSASIQEQAKLNYTTSQRPEVKPLTPETGERKGSPGKSIDMSDDGKGAGGKKLFVGTVVIVNPESKIVAEFSAPVIGDSWLALPTRACIGGSKWYLKDDQEKLVPIEGGLWGIGDTVGLWKLAGERTFPGPGFATWQQEIPVKFLSSTSGKMSEPMMLIPSRVEGAFLYSSLEEPLDPGVFLQNGNVVGWSFGELLQGAYMWTLGSDTDIPYENYVDDFYNETFAGGREEYFSIALAKGSESSPQRQLQMFAESFWFQPKLSPEDTPEYLSVDKIYPYIIKLVKFIMDQGAFQYIATLSEEPLLREIGDPELLIHVVFATQKIYGIEAALNLMEGTGDIILEGLDEKEQEGLRQFHLKLYTDWIKNLLDNGETVRGWQVYNRARPRFNESPELHLLSVELALNGGNWAEAESLLYQREYPASLRETWMLLAEKISDLKGQENKIVVEFPPGSSQIKVSANINDNLDHEFVVDTGASFVTIPYDTVESLGLKDKMSRHQQEVQTAGGPVSANAVVLSSIELQGWVVYDVKALVMDLPNRPGLGLLGLNFLDSFRVDLQTEAGVLTLEPK